MQAWVKAGNQHPSHIFLNHCPPHFSSHGLSLNLELSPLTKLTHQWGPMVLFQHIMEHVVTSSFYMVLGDVNSGPHGLTATTFLQPFDLILWCTQSSPDFRHEQHWGFNALRLGSFHTNFSNPMNARSHQNWISASSQQAQRVAVLTFTFDWRKILAISSWIVKSAQPLFLN